MKKIIKFWEDRIQEKPIAGVILMLFVWVIILRILLFLFKIIN